MPLTAADKDAMLAQGFPEPLQTAFKQTAEETRCVILSRVPGEATTKLIAEGHDLKGFFIKAKSCDWGPMTGFLCQLPAFNKKGVGGIEHNAKNNLKYHKMFCDRLRPPQEGVGEEEPATAAKRIKSIFAKNKLKWQEEWSKRLLDPQDDPVRTIEKLRDFLNDKDQQVVNDLSALVADVEKVFTGVQDAKEEDATKEDERFEWRLKAVVHDLRVLVGDDSPFVPLKLTPEVFAEFKKNASVYTKTIGDITCGVASKQDQKKFVCFAYVIKKIQQKKQPEELYELYHGEIRVSIDDDEQDLEGFLDALNNEEDKPVVGAKGKDVLLPLKEQGIKLGVLCPGDAAEVVKALQETWDAFASQQKLTKHQPEFKDDSVFYPIKGIQNYYPPFSGDNAHLNAVTGDYDLFACWPKIPSGGLEELMRRGERAATWDSLFSRMLSKPYSLQSTASPNVLVEVIPTFEELQESRAGHTSFGYVNDLVFLVAGTLNCFVNSVNLGSVDPPPNTLSGRNVAFHGDEGGRPEIDDVDYAVAAFVPRKLMATGTVSKDLIGEESDNKNPQMFVITNHVELLTLINAVKPHCYVPLNFAWMYGLLKYEKGNDVEDVKRLLKEVFWTDAADSNHEILKEAFAKLFDRESKMTSEQKVDLLAELTADSEPAS